MTITIDTVPETQSTPVLVDLAEVPPEGLARAIREESQSGQPRFFYLGRRSYRPTWSLQREIHALRVGSQLPDTVLFVEHDPVYTLGKNAGETHLLQGRADSAEVVRTDRGGDITFHGPGQLVGYPIVKLSNRNAGVSRYLRDLERAIIHAVAEYGVSASQIEGLTGVWANGSKLAALGVRLSRWTTMHGFAINVDVDMTYYSGIVPCGILEYGVINLNELLSLPTRPYDLAQRLVPHLTALLKG